jgi:Zn-dependent peptidase ImmA (M78 family)
MLRWAREWRGRSVAEAAHRVGRSEAVVLEWENPEGNSAPTVRQARILADFYERPFLEFFAAEAPSLSPVTAAPDYRLHGAPSDERAKREGVAVQLWAEEQRLNALDLMAMIGESVPEFPSLTASVSDDTDDVAKKARLAIDFPTNRQLNQPVSQRDQLPAKLRRQFERHGILTLKNSALREASARGLALAVFPLPIIVVGSEAPTAQAFTLVHELGHLMLRQSAISGPIPAPREGGPAAVRRTEEWCNRFAAAFLVPQHALELLLEKPANPWVDISDTMLQDVSALFGVSQHAMLIRLVNLRYVRSEYYWEVKREQFVQQERDYKSFARASYYGSRYRSNCGDLYTGLVLEAWSSGVITNHNAAEFMGIENLRHLNDVREHFSER